MAAHTNTGGVTKENLIAIGRPDGPDLQLKFTDNNILNFQDPAAPPGTAVGGIIRGDSSITEVLNMLSFLISTDRVFANLVDTANSVENATTSGAIDATTGYYNAGGGVIDPNMFAAAALLDINTLTVTAPADVHFPVSILKRRGPDAVNAPNDPKSFDNVLATKLITTGVNAETEVKALFSDCVKQMIKLLQQTRTILGPKGWTDLFQKVKGGSKKTQHRRHRRKYSSKYY